MHIAVLLLGYRVFLILLHLIWKSEGLVIVPECFLEVTQSKFMQTVRINKSGVARDYTEHKMQTLQKLHFSFCVLASRNSLCIDGQHEK